MISFFQRHHRILFYSSWLVLALTQSASTELIADEAYYWVYSKFPAWGYFDHPPMIAVLIKTGYSLFHNELGVRLICAFLSTFTILITEWLTDKKNPFLFYTIALSIGILQITGFFAVPDTPLLFLTAAFFYVYRNYLQITNWQNGLLLAIVIALLFYTKYHGLLIVFFTFLSNLKLFTRWQTWLAVVFVLMFYSPHLFWQWQHDWVSFRYHLFESNVSTYRFSYTTDYLIGQLLLSGPLAGFILLPAAIIYRTNNQFERALKFTMAGIYLIFLISSFRGKVELNWPMPALVPLMVLSHQFIIDKASWIKPLRIVAVVSLLLIIAGRLYLAVDLGPDNSTKGRFHNNKAWARAVSEKTGDLPVVFNNSYQRASLFWFYSGKPSHSHNPYWDRRNNYNFWPTERNLLGKKIFLADVYGLHTFPDSVRTKKGWVGFQLDTMYAALGGMKLDLDNRYIQQAGSDSVFPTIRITPVIPEQYSTFVRNHPGMHTELLLGVFKGKELVKEFRLGITAKQLVDQLNPFEASIAPRFPKGKYTVRAAIESNSYFPTHNSNSIDIIIK